MNSGGNFMMYSLLLLSSLLHITTGTVYTVTPDDHYYPNITCHHCHNLQHYLLNITKYFTFNTQLLFLPGLHHLHTDLVIQNLCNISFIGSKANGKTLGTTIYCNSSSIIMSNISTVTIRKIRISAQSLNIPFSPSKLPELAPLTIKNCLSVSLYYLHIYIDNQLRTGRNIYKLALVAINLLGNSYFDHVTCYDGIQILYNETHTDILHHNLSIMNNCILREIKLDMLQHSYRVTLKIIHLHVYNVYNKDKEVSFIHAEELGSNAVLILNCQFFLHSDAFQFSFASTNNGSL